MAHERGHFVSHCVFMGGVGTTIGMQKYRHKTNHPYFRYGLPALAVLNVLTLVAAAVLAFR